MSKFVALIIAGLIFLAPQGIEPAKADWRTDLGTFRVGIVAPGNRAEAQRQTEPFRLALAEALGMDVEVFFAKDYGTLINAQLATRIEYAVMSASSYALTWLQCECVEPIVVPMGSDQSKSYRAILISGPQGPSNTQNLNSRRVLFPKLDVLGGFSFAAFELAKAEILAQPPEPTENQSGPEDTVSTFMRNPQSVLLGWSSLTGNPSTGYSRGTLRSLASKIQKNVTDFKIIWKSSDIPHPPHVIKKSLPTEAKEILRNSLRPMYENDPVAYDAVEQVFGGGFAIAKHEHYARFIEFVRETVSADLKPEDGNPGQ